MPIKPGMTKAQINGLGVNKLTRSESVNRTQIISEEAQQWKKIITAQRKDLKRIFDNAQQSLKDGFEVVDAAEGQPGDETTQNRSEQIFYPNTGSRGVRSFVDAEVKRYAFGAVAPKPEQGI